MIRRFRLPRLAAATLLIVAVSGCAVSPAFRAESLPSQTAPATHLVAEAPQDYLDQPVVWGGMIVEINNFANHSEIEILAYPLDAKQRPLLDQPDHGRFIALVPGYVEAKEYPLGRFVSLIGRITGDRRGAIRESVYVWPEVDVDRIYLWPKDFREPRMRFGVGVGVSF